MCCPMSRRKVSQSLKAVLEFQLKAYGVLDFCRYWSERRFDQSGSFGFDANIQCTTYKAVISSCFDCIDHRDVLIIEYLLVRRHDEIYLIFDITIGAHPGPLSMVGFPEERVHHIETTLLHQHLASSIPLLKSKMPYIQLIAATFPQPCVGVPHHNSVVGFVVMYGFRDILIERHHPPFCRLGVLWYSANLGIIQ